MFAPFYHQVIRKYQIAFGSLFNNVTLIRNNSTGREQERFVIPIEYSSQEAWLSRYRRDPELTRRSEVTVPRMAFEMTGLRYDNTRQLNPLNQRTRPTLDGSLNNMRRYFVGTPYVMSLSLYALTRNVEDANQIVEQITPYFTPNYDLLVKLIPSIGILDRMRIVMDGNPQWVDNYEETALDSKRDVTLTFNFNAHVTMYGPISAVPPSIIRKVYVDLYEAGRDTTLMTPSYYLTDALDRLILENTTGRLIAETTVQDIRDVARLVSLEILPDPVDAPPTKPVNTTTTITDYQNGTVTNVFTGQDEFVGS